MEIQRRPIINPGPFIKWQSFDANVCKMFNGKSDSIFFLVFVIAFKNYTNVPLKCPLKPVRCYRRIANGNPVQNIFSFQDTYLIKLPTGPNNRYPLIPQGRYKMINRFHSRNETLFNYITEIEIVHHRATIW